MAAIDDQDVRDRAGKDLQQSFIVDAGAGTGKTTVLISRILGVIASGRSSLDRIVAITFTEKAAGELKVRLRGELEKALRGFESERWSYVRDALVEIERAQVSTIHSFCATLLRERPIEAGVDTGFEVLDEIGANLLLDQSWEAWLAREMDQTAGILAEGLEAGIRIDDLYRLGKFLIHHRDLLKFPAPVREDREPFFRCLDQNLSRLDELRSACLDPKDRAWIQIESILEGCREMTQASSLRRCIGRPYTFRPSDGNQKNWSPNETLVEVKDRISELKESYEKLMAAVRHNLAVALLEWLKGYALHYEAAKRERGCLDFFDLLYRTRELLKRNLDARRYFQGRFDYILVDEFQDTDPLQVEIFFYLAEISPKAKEWSEVKLQPGKLFLVGDPKQSIYRFRRADIETYHTAEEILSRQGAILDLSLNFRSRPQVVDWVNGLFCNLIRPSQEGFYQPSYRPIIASCPEREEASVVLMPLAPQVPARKGSAAHLRAIEARTMASFIKKIVAKGWPVWGRQDGKKRKIRYGDVGILFRAKEAIDLYEEEFRDFEVPYRVAGGRRYYSRQEMGALLAVLSAINNPKDKAALTAALRSPFFSASDEDLFLLIHKGHALDYLSPGAGSSDLAESIRDAFSLLRELHVFRNEIPVPRFLLKLYEKTRVLPFLYLKPQGDQKVANLIKVVDMARSLARQGLVTLRSFVEFLRKMESSEVEEGESPLAEESEDAVRIMTIHKAKGLEFPLVVVADAAYQSKSRTGEGIVNRQEGSLEVRFGNSEVSIATLGWEATREKERLREEAEDRRLLYVAATRARDYLVIPLIPGDQRRFLGPLSQDLGITSEVPFGEKLYPYGRPGPAVHVYDSRKLDVQKKELKPFRINIDGKRQKRIPSLTRFRNWEQALERVHEAGKESAPVVAAGDVIKKTEERKTFQGWRQNRGALLGSFVHDLFYQLDFHRPDGLEAMAHALGRKYGLKESEVERGVEMVQWGLSSGVVQRASRSPNLYREVPFVWRLDDNPVHGSTSSPRTGWHMRELKESAVRPEPIEGRSANSTIISDEGSLVEGFIDLVFEEDGELVIVDYKTDAAQTPGELEEKARLYQPQGEVYAAALEKITRMKVKEAIFIFLSAKAEKSFPQPAGGSHVSSQQSLPFP